jgi:uncharacterized cupredoxin-like copper-binding protein
MSILAGTLAILCLAAGLTAGLLGFDAAPAAGKTGARSATITIAVTAGKPSEYRFTLSKKSVPAGSVVAFKVTNKGKKPHSFAIAGVKSKVVAPGKTAQLTVELTKAGSVAYSSSVRGDGAAGMKGVFVVATAVSLPGPRPTTTVATTTTATTPAGGCASPVATTVAVTLFEFGITLSRTTVPCGTLTFTVTNTGTIPHNFDLVGFATSANVNGGESTTVTGSVTRAGSFRYQCDVGNHAAQGMAGTLTVT